MVKQQKNMCLVFKPQYWGVAKLVKAQDFIRSFKGRTHESEMAGQYRL